MMQLGAEVSQKIRAVENKDEVLLELQAELSKAASEYLAAARTASGKRKEAARKLEKLVEQEANDLAMKVAFRIEFAARTKKGWTSAGFDQVTYMISTNPGEPMHPLEHIASGGELSRVMLALKSDCRCVDGAAGKKKGAQRTMVFDEIDTGIGGRAAEAVGKKLKTLSRSSQVLCVTHLPQIATFADHHYLIEKKTVGQRRERRFAR